MIKRFLTANRITQADVARGIDRSSAYVSQLVNGDTGASQETINALLAYLSGVLARKVTYEELFAPEPDPADDLVAPELGGEA